MHQIPLYDQIVAARSPIPPKTTKIGSDHHMMVGNVLKTTENFEVTGGRPPVLPSVYVNIQICFFKLQNVDY